MDQSQELIWRIIISKINISCKDSFLVIAEKIVWTFLRAGDDAGDDASDDCVLGIGNGRRDAVTTYYISKNWTGPDISITEIDLAVVENKVRDESVLNQIFPSIA